MNFKNIRYIAKKLNAEGGKKKFVGFTRAFAFISIMLGSASLIIALSVLDGFENELRNTAVKFTSHIVLKGFDAKPVKEYSSKISSVKSKFKEIKSIYPVIQKEALIRGKNGIDGIMLKGVLDGEEYTKLTEDAIISGEFNTDANSIVIGKALAEKTGVSMGDKVLIYSIDIKNKRRGMPEYKQFEITGIYETGMMQYDESLAFISFSNAKKLAKLPEDNCSHLEIMLNDYTKAPEISLMLDDFIGFPYFTLTVFDLHAAIFAWIELQKEPIPLVLGLISLVAVLNIITSVLVLIVEKTYSIGILRSLGIKNADLLKIFIWKGMKIGVYGSVAGSLIAYLLLLAQKHYEIIRLKGEIYFLTVAPVDISLWHYQLVIGVSLLLSFLVTIIPALITLKISPLRAIRFN
jgi:lipoprotein-releasing system permease protein